MKRMVSMKAISGMLAIIMAFVSYLAIPAKAIAENAEEAEIAEAINTRATQGDGSSVLTHATQGDISPNTQRGRFLLCKCCV